MSRVAVLQSNYIPWKGYFDLIGMVDTFIFYDDLQFTKNDWRNRNRIKTPNGTKWLSIPCGINTNRLICEVELTDAKWQQSHWSIIYQSYGKAPYFKYYEDFVREIYLNVKWKSLSDLNQSIIRKISTDLLGFNTIFEDSRQYALEGQKAERLKHLLLLAGATNYLSGPAAQNYLDEKLFMDAGINVEWMDYNGYPEYDQLYPPFEHGVSILDLLFHTGPRARYYLKSNPEMI